MPRPPPPPLPPPPAAGPPRPWALSSIGVDVSPTGVKRRRALSLAHDAATAAVSLTDVVLDVLVCLQFRRDGHVRYFQCSVAIFAVAQVAYAFLFAAKHCRTVRSKVVWFALALPLSQLFPVFSWLETLRLPRLDAGLRRLGLHPSGDPAAADAPDDLWSALSRKIGGHSGFIAEALVEAVPQALLQIHACVALRQVTGVTATSVALSISVIASKGYLVSFSLHQATFLLNCAAVAADVVGLFASAAWLAAAGPGSPLAAALVSLAGAGLLASAALGGLVVLFSALDDSIKSVLYSPVAIGKVAVVFDLYLVRGAAFALGALPASVAYLACRLVAIPTCALKSLDPAHYLHPEFYSALMRFVHTGEALRRRRPVHPDLRVNVANAYLAAAQTPAARARLHTSTRYATPATERRIVASWAKNNGRPLWQGPTAAPAAAAPRYVGVRSYGFIAVAPSHQRAEAEAEAEAAAMEVSEQEKRRASRRKMNSAALARAHSELERSLVRKSVCFRFLADAARLGRRGAVEEFVALSDGSGPLPAALLACTVVVAALAALVACGWAVVTVAAVLAVPAVPIAASLATCGAAAALPCGLSAAYVALLAIMAIAAPSVSAFQRSRRDTAPLAETMPRAFYSDVVVDEIARRAEAADTAAALFQTLRGKIGNQMAIRTLRFAAPFPEELWFLTPEGQHELAQREPVPRG